jgi:nitroimidazol reductase NimA-like FMN-containing flavoprotein (pyridoxamine 5'-phosphate oxidase superfamily)
MTKLVELAESECSELLRSHHTGRVGFVIDERPLILPVNYVVHRDQIVFRTAPGRKLAEIPMRHVAFEVDGASANGSWSVVAQGFAREMTDALGEAADRIRALPIPIEAPGERDYWIAIAISELTGRRIEREPGDAAPGS